MTLHISKDAADKVGSAILISGSGRSGTTIIGKLLHSFKGVEYAFEPPMLVTLMPLIHKMDEHTWRLLYETYLYEDFLINALSGRLINTNQADDSSIYQVKTESELHARLSRSIRKVEAEQLASFSTLVYKLPNIVPLLPKLAEYYPATRFLIMKREAIGTINSLIQKEWFSDVSVRASTVWPYRLVGDIKVPSWVKEEDDAIWANMSEIDRCAYYYIRVNENLENIPNKIELSYQKLLNNPQAVAEELADSFGLEFGEKTPEIITSIQPADRNRDLDILHKISPALLPTVVYFSDRSV
ncbi:MAG: sulfotransferase [Methylophilaceae bacterium]